MQGLALPEQELVVDHSVDGAPAAGATVEGETIADASISGHAGGDDRDPEPGGTPHVDRTA